MSGSQDPRSPSTHHRSVLRRRGVRVVRRLVVLGAGAAVLAGCGGSDGGDPTTTATAAKPTSLALTLDFAPNAVHTGLYIAQDSDLFRTHGVDLKIRIPGSGADGAKLLAAGRTDVAIMDIHDVALAREKGADLVAVGAIVQRPLAAVLASKDVRRPLDLEGRTVGVTGLPSDDAALDQIVRGDGGDPKKVERVTIGFEAVPSVVSGKVDAAIGFWNAEGVALQERRPGTRVFRLDEFGAPRYPELLLVATSRTLAAKGDAVARLAKDVGEGYRVAATAPTDPRGTAIRALREGSGDRSIDPKTTEQQLEAVQPAFRDSAGRAGTIDRAAMRRWATWEAKVGITKTPPDVGKLVWSRAPGS